MSLPTPSFSRSQVNRAGDFLIAENAAQEALEWAYDVLNNWRACHNYPVNTFQATLRQRLGHIDTNAIVAQRLKRTPSIIDKLKRFTGMKLSRMQDIGGLRAIVKSLPEVRSLDNAYQEGKLTHELVGSKDYIEHPKTTEYRSIHLIYKYKNPKTPDYDGLLLELQIRSRPQHAWATAVETMGTFLGEALKSSQGQQKWLRFFELTGSAFAYLERTPLVPGYENLSRQDTFRAVADAELELGIIDKLDGFTVALNTIPTGKHPGTHYYHLIVLDSESRNVEVASYGRQNFSEATVAYAAAEERIAKGDRLEAVLVSAGPLESLRRAYPNYFLDTRDFIHRIQRIIQAAKAKPSQRPIQQSLPGMEKPARRRTR